MFYFAAFVLIISPCFGLFFLGERLFFEGGTIVLRS